MLIASGFSWFHLIPSVSENTLLTLIPKNTYQFVGAWFVCAVLIVAALVASDATHEENVTEVFLRILARDPTDAESAVAVEFLRNENNKDAAYQSFIWSLLATNEFLFTH